jgi:nitric-oxide synthase
VTARAFLAALRNGRSNYAGTTVPLERRLRRLSGLEQKEEARAFLTLFYQESGRTKSALGKRWAEVRRSLSKTGTYEHTQQELAYGARVAWRNHGRCIGRLYWESILDRMVQHARFAWRGSHSFNDLRFCAGPVEHAACYIESDQITQYAGYIQPDGSVLGDRQNVEATRISASLGFRAPDPRCRFDLLPILMRDRSDRLVLGEVPRNSIREVSIVHPNGTPCPASVR